MKKISFFFLIIPLLLSSCSESPSPKPYGYFRIEPENPEYNVYRNNIGYSFLLSSKTRIETIPDTMEGKWFDIVYPSLNAKIHCSYLPVTSFNFPEAAEDSRNFVYRHTIVADAIREQIFSNPGKKVYGIQYNLKGNVASPIQFVLTDSSSHFFRGALYFECIPNQDSLAPVIEYIQKDITELMNSFSWED